MKVDNTHPEYDTYKEQWSRCETVQAGGEAVKKLGDHFLPRLENQTDAQYNAYKKRALFYGATERTIQGLVGAVFAKEPIFHLDGDEDKEFFDSLSIDKVPFIDFAKNTFSSVINPSRIGLLADVAEDGETIYVVSYETHDIINWKVKIINGAKQPTQVVLHETYYDETDDEFVQKLVHQWRVLDLVESNGSFIYRQRVFQEKDNKTVSTTDKFFQVGDDIYPTKRGKNLDFIPFVVINPSKIGFTVEKPICLDMVDVNLSHYCSSADLEHGRHFTGLPTAWVAGFDVKNTKLVIGSAVAWVSQNPHATAGFLEFTGQGLKTLENALQEKEKLLTILGARILEGQKDAVENAETQKTRRLGENSILANIADTVSSGLTKIVQIVADWRGLDSKVRIELNKEYTSISADAQTLTALMAALQQGAVSFDTWFYNLKKWQMVPAERGCEEELSLIEVRQGGLSLAPQMVTPEKNQQRPTALLANGIEQNDKVLL